MISHGSSSGLRIPLLVFQKAQISSVFWAFANHASNHERKLPELALGNRPVRRPEVGKMMISNRRASEISTVASEGVPDVEMMPEVASPPGTLKSARSGIMFGCRLLSSLAERAVKRPK